MKKKIIIVILAIILFVLFVPTPRTLKDGGTVEYTASFYKISKVHSLNSIGAEKQYKEGIIIELFGIKIYNNVK